MPAPITSVQFLAKAHQVHGEAYDYSRVEFVNTKTKVEVLCRSHGPFAISPDNHMRGKGCPACGRVRQAASSRKSTNQFIDEARQVHGDKYDYGQVDYSQARAPVTIVCSEHGPFVQTAGTHLSGAGCPKCGLGITAAARRATAPDFLGRARERFGDRFDYSKVEYRDRTTPVEIVCAHHGAFTVEPAKFLQSTHGCPKCWRPPKAPSAPKKPVPPRITQGVFLERALAVHGDKYDYSQVACESQKSRVTIVCKTHGPFVQAAGDHLAGKGCRKCASQALSDARRETVDSFIAKARAVHGDKYDYSRAVYRGALAPLTIVCPVHGEFEQPPHTHLNSGCRKCADDELPGAYSLKVLNRDPVLANAPAVLYYLRFDADNGEHFYKVGITLKSVAKRFAGYGGAGYTVTQLRVANMPLIDAFRAEQTLLKQHCKKCSYTPQKGNRKGWNFGGRTECFSEPLPADLWPTLRG